MANPRPVSKLEAQGSTTLKEFISARRSASDTFSAQIPQLVLEARAAGFQASPVTVKKILLTFRRKI